MKDKKIWVFEFRCDVYPDHPMYIPCEHGINHSSMGCALSDMFGDTDIWPDYSKSPVVTITLMQMSEAVYDALEPWEPF